MPTAEQPTPATVGATVLGYPRMGRDRELKRALERNWSGRTDLAALRRSAARVRRQRLDALASLAEIPLEFALYDQVQETSWLVGAVPTRFASVAAAEPEELRFAMARGTDALEPLEMTKWFDTNYHYLVPELRDDEPFALHADALLALIAEAGDATPVRPVVVGPLTYLSLAKAADDASDGFEPLQLLDRLLPVYEQLLTVLAEQGIAWVQLDEPILSTDLSEDVVAAFEQAYGRLAATPNRPKIMIAQYFGHLGPEAARITALPVEGLALDVSQPAHVGVLQEPAVAAGLATKRVLAGVVDGHNVWAADLAAALDRAAAVQALAAETVVSSSCSLLHVPHDVSREESIPAEQRAWLAFADQKIVEVATIARGLDDAASISAELDANRAVLAARAASPLTKDPAVRARAAAVGEDDLRRRSGYDVRSTAQAERLGLPALPTTTIGSFPQTGELRKARADRRAGRIDDAAYDEAMRDEIASVIALQERLGLDVLVHGEPERNDMVQYFADQLNGVLSTEHGWVQSYGSRCVRPPIIAGDVSRPEPMTVAWSTYAQSLTDKPVKGMLTGPVTMLAWSFVRDDQPRGDTARQMALALRDEVVDLEKAGLTVIQVDEPALRETLPLRAADRPAYLRWAVDAFRLSTAGVTDATQVHTHMCYAEFGDIVDAIGELDADVISLEAARSKMAVVAELSETGYPREVGPGVWDIHSPRVPAQAEVVGHLQLALERIAPRQLWVNPDCGLKTRGYAEVEASLAHLVSAAEQVRASLA